MNKYKKIQVKDGKLIVEFALFKNDDRKSENHPNAKSWDKENKIGAAAWTRESQNGVKFQSCKIDIDLDVLMHELGMGIEPGSASSDDFSEDLPF